MYYCYVLQSEKDHSFYIGQTNDIEARLKRHNNGYVTYSSRKIPWKVFWQKGFETREEAMAMERKLKNLKSTKKMLEYIGRMT